ILYIVMEWVDGDALARLMRVAPKAGAPLPHGASMRNIAETCSGLHAAHQPTEGDGARLGSAHRDVLPHHNLITTAGTAKVIDFGLVKARNRAAGPTRAGIVKGKIRYMAPEQVVTGAAIDHRADVWAAGMCLLELVSRQTPYHELDDLDVVKK